MPQEFDDEVKSKKKILLRIDKKLHSSLKKWADDDLRSINSQIEFILRSAIQKR
jgi:hypothetical protein